MCINKQMCSASDYTHTLSEKHYTYYKLKLKYKNIFWNNLQRITADGDSFALKASSFNINSNLAQ